MRILFGGGGSGGHFYPIIAIAERIRDIIEEEKIVDAKLYYLAPEPYDEKALFENGIAYRPITAGKLRRYFSFRNAIDAVKTAVGVLRALWQVYLVFPDVVFGKGGWASFPTLLAARVLGIPVMVHESDSVPGRTNRWASKFARRIAISFEEAVSFFPAAKTAYTGQPIRKEILKPLKEGAHEYLKLDPTVPTILILGGSQGAELVNDAVFRALPELLSAYQVIHQVGPKNLENAEKLASVILKESPHAGRYRAFGYLNDLSMRMAAGISSLIVSRAGSTLFEIAAWGIPSILIPITDSNGDHQRKNAFNYARAGACVVVEEANLTPHVLISQIAKLMENEAGRAKMAEAAQKFHRPDAAKVIAKELIALALEHEPR
ncbi:MAG: UDP-N-acetylglucosamine--N-acetylmuramyl-(pentapeptide) pyrophosphoryl-undecaprenol N-acetylglucosamine transferase [bacterium]|nr:UDP-N-acetylglucosamine--N-acetylmuramyl-(pentapeptide) pyrophosphoryl-undecaprenol N-acetylglucosamine transferase [bacterium]